MEKTEITLEYTEQTPAFGKAILPPKQEKKPLPLRKLAAGAGLCLLGLLWGRVELMGLLHPMGIAYLSAFFGEGLLFWGIWAAVGLGAFLDTPLKTGAALAAALAVEMTLGRFVLREDMGKKALLGAFSMGLAGIFYAIGCGGFRFYFVVAGMESGLVLCISFLAQKAILLLLDKPTRAILTREELLSLLLLAGGGLAGLGSLAQPLLRDGFLPAAAAFLLLFAARQEGIGGGAAAGMLFGFLLYLSGSADLPLFFALAMGGMLAGCLKELGRLASALAMVAAPVIFLFYIDAAMLQPIWMGGLIAGALLFILFPKRLLEKAALREMETPKDRYTKMKELTEERLKASAAAFQALSKTFATEGEQKDKGEISELVDTIANRVCKNCGMAHYCWEEELYRSYSMTFSALSYCDGRGRVTFEQMPPHFREHCIHPEAFLEAVHTEYAGYRRDCVWGNRLAECRELVGQQLGAVGNILQSLSGEMEWKGNFLEGAEESLLAALKKEGLRPQRLIVTEEAGGRGRQVRLQLAACGGKGICREKILPLVKKSMGCPMALQQEGLCSCDAAARTCFLCFQEEPPFAVTAATAFSPAEEGAPMGDAAAFLQMGTEVLLALSDGMGTGEAAAKESRVAIELLEQFTEAGFDRELAVKMINSALLLRRGEETYATLDICHIDRFNGHAEFIKLGAVASYIRRGERILSLRASALPAGILKQVQAEKNEMLLKDGDLLFLMTDGVTDAIGGEERAAAWLKDRLDACPMANPQDAAAYILQEAKKERRDARRDDMTVLAARFWRKRG